MEKLQIKLPSGQIRFITRIDDNDAKSSIYESAGMERTPDNLDKLRAALGRWPEIEIMDVAPKRTGCWLMAGGGIKCYGH